MYLHVKQKIVTLATALCLTVGAGTAAATPASGATIIQGPLKTDPGSQPVG